MPFKKLMMFGGLLAGLAVSQTANAQINVPSAEFEHRPIEMPDGTRPFATPGVFDYDAQVFAPLEFTNGDEKEANTGFYFTFDKVYSSVSKAHRNDANFTGANSGGSHYIWGTRYEAGWMNEEDTGWGIAFQQAEGVDFAVGKNELISFPMLVTNQYATFEVNRYFRQKLRSGGTFEPYIGGQYLNISDDSVFDADPPAGLGDSARFLQEATNSAFGVHAGARFNQRRGRWRYTADGAMTAAYNQQRYSSSDIVTTGNAISLSENYDSDQSFIPALDLQLEVAFNVSRDISLRAGIQTLYMLDGVARIDTSPSTLNPNSVFGSGPSPALANNDNSFLAAGFIFGAEWKR